MDFEQTSVGMNLLDTPDGYDLAALTPDLTWRRCSRLAGPRTRFRSDRRTRH
jgi:hypothetical protein